MVDKKGLSNFNISNNIAYLFIGILSFILIGVGVYAYNYPGPPSEMGHTVGEMISCNTPGQTLAWNGNSWFCQDPISLPTCTAGQILKMSGGEWVCENFVQVFQCPRKQFTLYCTKIKLFSGIDYCHGQLSLSSSCYYLDNYCNYNGVFGYCTPVGTNPPVCGDRYCDPNYESCGTCEEDCGSCLAPCYSYVSELECEASPKNVCIWNSVTEQCEDLVCSLYLDKNSCVLAGCPWDYSRLACGYPISYI